MLVAANGHFVTIGIASVSVEDNLSRGSLLDHGKARFEVRDILNHGYPLLKRLDPRICGVEPGVYSVLSLLENEVSRRSYDHCALIRGHYLESASLPELWEARAIKSPLPEVVYLSEERPPEQRGDRTLLELAIAEARRYGWEFLIIDQMPLLLSRYVWDNMGTVIVHRLANMDSYNVVKKVLVVNPLTQSEIVDDYLAPILLSLPEDIALYRKYFGATLAAELPVGVVGVPKVK